MKTGVGKSTLIDLIWSNKTKNGEYILNGKTSKFNSNIINLLTIVPQRINLLDASVKDNIVFTQKYKNENELLDKLENLKHICKLEILDKKPKDGIKVGENGTKLVVAKFKNRTSKSSL